MTRSGVNKFAATIMWASTALFVTSIVPGDVFSVLSADQAHAKPGGKGGNGKGNGGGGGRGNSGSSGKSASASSAGGASAAGGQGQTKTKNLRAQMGALNAVNASATAMLNASPNSRVGKIAAYAAASSGVQDAQAAVDEAERLLNEAISAAVALGEDPELNQGVIDARAQLALATDALAASTAMLSDALAAAANKPITPEVQAEVDRILAGKVLTAPTTP